jgi:Ornithine/acetylornithine aminotransferase
MQNTKRNSNVYRSLFFKYLGQTSAEPMGVEVERAKGVRLYGPCDKSYIDLISGVSVSNIGHAHPAVVKAITEQAQCYSHLMVYGEFIQAPQVDYAALLAAQLPPSLQSIYFVNSGSEAVEAALKLAKRVTGRRELVGCKNAYHGSTHGALSLMGGETFKNAFRPLLPGVRHIHFNAVADLEQISAKTAAVIVEPVQGEAGVIPPERSYLQALRARCDEVGALLIFDEIQTGFGRSGSLFAFQKYGVVPDMLCLAKALGGGLPLGALVAGPQLMQAWQSRPVLGHITTFGGHPLSCAAGKAALSVLLQEGWTECVEKNAAHFRRRLQSCQKISEIRGDGLLLACELGDVDLTWRFLRQAIDNGIISDNFLFCGTAFRISPPLCISAAEIDEACDKIIQTLDNL